MNRTQAFIVTSVLGWLFADFIMQRQNPLTPYVVTIAIIVYMVSLLADNEER